jgi:hypothetical protein
MRSPDVMTAPLPRHPSAQLAVTVLPPDPSAQLAVAVPSPRPSVLLAAAVRDPSVLLVARRHVDLGRLASALCNRQRARIEH